MSSVARTDSTVTAVQPAPDVKSRKLNREAYVEGGEWVRQGNYILWITAFLFLPVSFGTLVLAVLRAPWTGSRGVAEAAILASVSIVLYTSWVYVSLLYRGTVDKARELLQQVEAAHGQPGFYANQGHPSRNLGGMLTVQFVIGAILLLMWGFGFASLR
jgi:hypothetical protein